MFHKKHPKSKVRIEIDYEERISRLFIFRCLWIPAIMVQFIAWSIWIGILSFIHFFYMLFLGQRSKPIFEHIMAFIVWIGRWQAYLKYLTNERPVVWPWGK